MHVSANLSPCGVLPVGLQKQPRNGHRHASIRFRSRRKSLGTMWATGVDRSRIRGVERSGTKSLARQSFVRPLLVVLAIQTEIFFFRYKSLSYLRRAEHVATTGSVRHPPPDRFPQCRVAMCLVKLCIHGYFQWGSSFFQINFLEGNVMQNRLERS